MLVFVACIELFFVGGRLGVPYVGFAFYVWVGIFSLTMIAQFWSFANDIYSKDDGDRLFPLIAVGSTAGAPLGAAVAAGAVLARRRTPGLMMQIAAGLLLLHLALYTRVSAAAVGGATAQAAGAEQGAAASRWSSPIRYLRLIALLLVLLNIVNSTGEFILARLVTGARAAAGGRRARPSSVAPSSAPSTAATSSG